MGQTNLGYLVGMGCTSHVCTNIIYYLFRTNNINNSYDDKSKADKYASILAVIGAVNLPIIKWSVNWWSTLHQPASISKFSSPSIDNSMLVPLFIMTFSFFFFFISILLVRLRGEIIQRKN